MGSKAVEHTPRPGACRRARPLERRARAGRSGSGRSRGEHLAPAPARAGTVVAAAVSLGSRAEAAADGPAGTVGADGACVVPSRTSPAGRETGQLFAVRPPHLNTAAGGELRREAFAAVRPSREARSVVGGRSARGGDAPPRAARGPFGPTASRSEDAVGAPPAHRAPRHRRAFERRRHGAPAVRPSPWTSDRGSAGNGHRAGARAPRRQVGALPLRRGGRLKPRYAPRWWVAPVRRCLGARPPLRRSVGDGFAERRREVVGGVARLDDPRRRRAGAGPYPRPCAHRPPALGTTARREGMQRATISQHPGPSFAAKSRARCRMLDGAGPRDRSWRKDVSAVFRAVPEPPRAKLRARSGSAPSPRAPARAHGDVADGRRTRSSRPGGAGCRHARTSGKAARSGPLRGRPGRRTARAAYSEASSAGFSRSTITCRPR